MDKNQKKILIVEDEKPMLKAIEDKLTREGFAVSSAENGREGLDKAISERPDLILLDLIMPEVDGMSMLKKLREDEWGRDVPVIVLTNVYEIDKMSEAVTLSTSGYLIKTDWKLEEVVGKIRQVLKLEESK